MKGQGIVEYVLIIVLVAIVALAIITIFMGNPDEKVCLDHGYPEIKRVGLTVYCARVRDGQSEVIPISELRD